MAACTDTSVGGSAGSVALVGMAGLLVANAIWRGSWAALAPVAGFVVIIDRLQIEAEESALLEKFEAAYEAYRAAPPRWLDRRSLDFAKPGRRDVSGHGRALVQGFVGLRGTRMPSHPVLRVVLSGRCERGSVPSNPIGSTSRTPVDG